MEKEIFSINVRNDKAIALTLIEKLKPSSNSVFNVCRILLFSSQLHLIHHFKSIDRSSHHAIRMGLSEILLRHGLCYICVAFLFLGWVSFCSWNENFTGYVHRNSSPRFFKRVRIAFIVYYFNFDFLKLLIHLLLLVLLFRQLLLHVHIHLHLLLL